MTKTKRKAKQEADEAKAARDAEDQAGRTGPVIQKEQRHPEVVRLEMQEKVLRNQIDHQEELLDDEKFHARQEAIREKISSLHRDLTERAAAREAAPAKIADLAPRADAMRGLRAKIDGDDGLCAYVGLQRRANLLKAEIDEDDGK